MQGTVRARLGVVAQGIPAGRPQRAAGGPGHRFSAAMGPEGGLGRAPCRVGVARWTRVRGPVWGRVPGAVVPIAVLTLAFTLVTALVLAVLRGALLWLGRRRALGVRSFGRWLLVSLLLHLLLTVPLGLGLAGSRLVGTRGDERAWAGPRIDPASEDWLLQSRESLADEGDGLGAVDAERLAAAADRAVRFESRDGVPLRAFLVPPRSGVEPRATALIVHGLFRGGLEVEPVGAMFRDLGCEVLLLEMRNHGGSGRAPASFGAREQWDVLAAVDWLRGRDARAAARPLLLYGVSLGGAAVALAAPQVEDLAGLVLDAPMDTVAATADRMLQDRGHGGRRLAFPQPFRAMVLGWLQIWSDFDLDALRPIDAVRDLDPEVPVLLVGAGVDDRMPPAVVRAVFAALPQAEDRKRLWIRAGSGHGKVFEDDPDGYRERLAWLLDLAAPR